MKITSTVVAATLVASAFASPVVGDWKNKLSWKGEGGKGGDQISWPFEFTSTYSVKATPDQVVGTDNQATGGLSGASGQFDYWINSQNNFICWHIMLKGFRGDYQSAALTSTHIHQGQKGKAGPPRVVFPNPIPTGKGDERASVGCQQGPFKTNITSNGQDTGAGFTVAQIEASPADFFTDVHSSLAVPGAVRGQL